jgi:hypothetical protein
MGLGMVDVCLGALCLAGTHGHDLPGVVHQGGFDGMVLWTIQRTGSWDELRATGILRGRAERVPPEWRHAYAWMRERMARQVGPPPAPDVCPVWAWHWYYGRRKPRPDLRYRGHLEKGAGGVRIEIECDPSDVLLSDFADWHAVLSNWHLAASPDDDDAFDAALKTKGLDHGNCGSDPEVAAEITASWERVFDLQRHVPGWTREPDERYVQATLWEVRMDQVRDVTPFVSR